MELLASPRIAARNSTAPVFKSLYKITHNIRLLEVTVPWEQVTKLNWFEGKGTRAGELSRRVRQNAREARKGGRNEGFSRSQTKVRFGEMMDVVLRCLSSVAGSSRASSGV